MTGRTVYIYDGNKLDKTSYNVDGKITFKTIEVFNEEENTIEKTFVRQDVRYSDSNALSLIRLLMIKKLDKESRVRQRRTI